MTESHRVRDLANMISGMTGAEIANLPNPRQEAVENELVVTNDRFLALGLQPTKLSEGLMEECTEIASKYIDRVDPTKIVARSVWRQGMEIAPDLEVKAPVTVVDLRDAEDRRAMAEEANQRLEGAPAQEILAWAAAAFPGRVAVTSSMSDTVIAHLAGSVDPSLPVMFVDTGYHFPETLAAAQAVADGYGVEVRFLTSPTSREDHEAQHGTGLFERDPDTCCNLRKVAPLDDALNGDFDAWISGLRRADGPSRAATPVVEWDERRGMIKINPIVAWSDEEVDAYTLEHGCIRNPLLDDGFPSIGCAPCTRRVAPGEDARAGRWASTGKTECGIHEIVAGKVG